MTMSMLSAGSWLTNDLGCRSQPSQEAASAPNPVMPDVYRCTVDGQELYS